MKPLPGCVLALIVAVFMPLTSAAADDEITSRIRRQPVSSSNVASIGYSRHLRALEIEFTRGAIYRFLDVPKSLYRELMESSSKGHFIAQNLRDQYRFVRVRAGQPASHDPLTAHE